MPTDRTPPRRTLPRLAAAATVSAIALAGGSAGARPAEPGSATAGWPVKWAGTSLVVSDDAPAP